MENSNPYHIPMNNKIKLKSYKLEANIKEVKWY